jgi:RpiR family carbohydrate utilization transcriptional regulator
VIAITADDSPLANAASLCLPMNSLQDEDLYAPIKSRMAHLAIVDVLAVGVALSRGVDLGSGADTAPGSVGLRRLSS